MDNIELLVQGIEEVLSVVQAFVAQGSIHIIVAANIDGLSLGLDAPELPVLIEIVDGLAVRGGDEIVDIVGDQHLLGALFGAVDLIDVVLFDVGQGLAVVRDADLAGDVSGHFEALTLAIDVEDIVFHADEGVREGLDGDAAANGRPVGNHGGKAVSGADLDGLAAADTEIDLALADVEDLGTVRIESEIAHVASGPVINQLDVGAGIAIGADHQIGGLGVHMKLEEIAVLFVVGKVEWRFILSVFLNTDAIVDIAMDLILFRIRDGIEKELAVGGHGRHAQVFRIRFHVILEAVPIVHQVFSLFNPGHSGAIIADGNVRNIDPLCQFFQVFAVGVVDIVLGIENGACPIGTEHIVDYFIVDHFLDFRGGIRNDQLAVIGGHNVAHGSGLAGG